MARSKIRPQFTTAIRNSSANADQSRTTVQAAEFGNAAVTFKNIASRAPSRIDGAFNALTYPEFGSAADGGHAIVFKINRAVPGTNKGGNERAARRAAKRSGLKGKDILSRKQAKEFRATQEKVTAISGNTLDINQLFASNIKSKFLPGVNTRKSVAEGLQFDTPKKRLDTAIVLYMPPQIQTTYGLNYSDVDMGFASQAMVGVFDAMGGAEVDVNSEQVTSFVKKAALAALNTAAPGAAAGLQIRMGAIISNKMELSFAGVNRREFQFVFNFTPKSENEANTIRDIITTFKYYAHPAFLEGTGGNMMTIPDSFDIEYRSHGTHNQYLHKISTCFCSSINVQYGGDRFTAHKHVEGRGSPPSKTILSLTFKEMELITKSRIDEGY
jgi:hypothetical protein